MAQKSGKPLDLLCSSLVFMLAIAFDRIARMLAFVVLKPCVFGCLYLIRNRIRSSIACFIFKV
jgi:hypothetical protein